jgi:protein PhnA
MGRFQSGQTGRTVNPLAQPSGVRIPPCPPFFECKPFKICSKNLHLNKAMGHFICKGSCKTTAELESVCETESCSNQWQLLEACECSDLKHFQEKAATEEQEVMRVKDSNGTELHTGDDVVLIKDLTMRGSSRTFKRGTKVSGIKLTDNPEEVDCRLEGTEIVLRVEFLKKL